MPSLNVVPVSLALTLPTASWTVSFMCSTAAYPLAALKTAVPLDSLVAAALPQYIFISCRALPVMVGIFTQMAASLLVASHCSIWYAKAVAGWVTVPAP